MGYRYTVIGAGRQGVAAAYDLALRGEGEHIALLDVNAGVARQGAQRVNLLLGKEVASPLQLDAADHAALGAALARSDGMLSAVPFAYNESLTDLAVETRTHLVDLGGHTGVVRRQLARDEQARAAGVCVVPDCGMGPGMNVTLALAAMDLLHETHEVRIYDGGLPQVPRPPWGYSLLFHVGGLLNEYEGHAYFLRGGGVTEIPALSELEEVEIPPLGTLEAFVTSGGLSTMPWTLAGRLQTLENKTLRYPGHCTAFKALRDAGLFSAAPLDIAGTPVAPRAVLEALLAARLADPDVRDVCVIHVRARGSSGGRPAEARVHLVDRYDEATGFLAMEKLTGWHAALVLALAVRGEIPPGAWPVESALSAPTFLGLAPARNWQVEREVSAARAR